MLLIRCCARDELLITLLILKCGFKGRSVGKPGTETFPWCSFAAATIRVLPGMGFPRWSPPDLVSGHAQAKLSTEQLLSAGN